MDRPDPLGYDLPRQRALFEAYPARPLAGHAALVTGASSGIGEGIARHLAAAGARVAVHYRSGKESADEVVGHVTACGGEAIAVHGDVSSEADVERMFAEAVAAFGTLHVVVSNAGLQKDAPFERMTLDDWRLVIDVNLTGQFLCVRSAVREFLRRGPDPAVSKALGKVVCVGSVHEIIPWAGHANYAASKGGLSLLMKTLAQEYAGRKIRFNGLAPGAVKTPINRDAWDTPEAERRLLKVIPYGRAGDTDDTGRAAVWLASDDSDYMTGTSLVIDGGMCLYPGFVGNG